MKNSGLPLFVKFHGFSALVCSSKLGDAYTVFQKGIVVLLLCVNDSISQR